VSSWGRLNRGELTAGSGNQIRSFAIVPSKLPFPRSHFALPLTTETRHCRGLFDFMAVRLKLNCTVIFVWTQNRSTHSLTNNVRLRNTQWTIKNVTIYFWL